jgi:hypothetical protein
MELAHPDITALRPVNKQVTLHDNTLVTVPVFDTRALIIDMLTNHDLMKKENFAVGYDILLGMWMIIMKLISITEKSTFQQLPS